MCFETKLSTTDTQLHSVINYNELLWVLKSWSKEGTVRHCQSQQASILWSHHEETRELPGERDNAKNNARCKQTRKTTHGLNGQHQHQLPVEESIRMTEDRDKWRKYIHRVANPRIEYG